MKPSFDNSILNTGQLMRRGYSFFAENAGKAVAVITGIVAVLVSFTEVGFCDFSAQSFTSGMLVMLLASYIIYFSMEDAGERLGASCDDYKRALSEYSSRCEAIGGNMILQLREFCTEYSKRELEYRRENMLMSLGYSPKEYEDHLSGAEVSAKARRAFKKARALKPLHITPSQLLSRQRATSKSELKNPERGKFLRLLIGLIPSTLCTLFTVSIVLQSKEGLTAEAVLESILKLTCLPIIGLRGYSGGYNFATRNTVGWMDTKTRLLDSFLSGLKKQADSAPIPD